MDKLLTAPQVAEILGCHKQTVYKNSSIPRVKLPGGAVRYRPSDIDKYIDSNTIKSPIDILQHTDNKTIRLLFPPDYGIMLRNESGGLDELAKAKSNARRKKFKGVYVRKTKCGQCRFYISFYEPNGKRVRKCVKNARTWEEALLARNEDIKRTFDVEYNVKRKRQKIKFEDFASMYLEDYAKTNKRSWETDSYNMKNLKKFFGGYYLTEITGQDIEKYKKFRLKDGVKQSTVNRCLALIRKMLNVAKDWGYLPEEWKIKIKLYPERNNARSRVLTEDEEKRLILASCEHLKPILVVALNTGMRRGEILNLKWEHLDLKDRKIRLVISKSGKARIIPMNSPLFDVFQELGRKNPHGEYVFLNKDTGKPYTTIKTAFKAACRRSGVKDLRFHDLRGTVGTRLDKKGVSTKIISKILGHSSPIITNQHYIRPSEEQELAALELLSEKLSKKRENLRNRSPICHAKQKEQRDKIAIPFFSVN